MGGLLAGFARPLEHDTGCGQVMRLIAGVRRTLRETSIQVIHNAAGSLL